MQNLELLYKHFSTRSIDALKDIFDTSSEIDKNDIKITTELNELMRRIIKAEMTDLSNKGTYPLILKTSPCGDTHILVICNLCFIINIFGVNFLFENDLFNEGELQILNFHWNEKDNLVVFDIHYMVHGIWQKCICHFNNTDFFVYFTAESAPERRDSWKF